MAPVLTVDNLEREGHWFFLLISVPHPSLSSSWQIIQRITWVSPPAITLEWKRKVAQEAIESLSASKLAKSICSQFRTRLNSSHEAFAASLRQVGMWERKYSWIKQRRTLYVGECFTLCFPPHLKNLPVYFLFILLKDNITSQEIS